ncbi:hypothetical protein DACRYDRAFT_108159 [Dacryopinax primogenitus]|uniref:Uncharacterized protein n=1 Tax=Dacryopinax primogenitus (strain DJM 731) TaxID=1858805 RepID=M5G0G6_DACPD|nr:uncharacterized protein DACRYDRAFT_108159 [Dacryopinax primogenitus]EJU01625.1 hypothetical protein DACRYDRAFT_108159 [Dacryopinax primogenitus]
MATPNAFGEPTLESLASQLIGSEGAWEAVEQGARAYEHSPAIVPGGFSQGGRPGTPGQDGGWAGWRGSAQGNGLAGVPGANAGGGTRLAGAPQRTVPAASHLRREESTDDEEEEWAFPEYPPYPAYPAYPPRHELPEHLRNLPYPAYPAYPAYPPYPGSGALPPPAVRSMGIPTHSHGRTSGTMHSLDHPPNAQAWSAEYGGSSSLAAAAAAGAYAHSALARGGGTARTGTPGSIWNPAVPPLSNVQSSMSGIGSTASPTPSNNPALMGLQSPPTVPGIPGRRMRERRPTHQRENSAGTGSAGSPTKSRRDRGGEGA